LELPIPFVQWREAVVYYSKVYTIIHILIAARAVGDGTISSTSVTYV